MDNRKNLYSIANAIYAADKIRNLLKRVQGMQDNSISGKRAYDDMAIFGEIIRVIADYFPDSDNYRRNSLRETVDKCALYGNAYKKLKQHMISTRNEGLTDTKIIEALVAIKPLIKGKRRTMIDKALEIYEILNT